MAAASRASNDAFAATSRALNDWENICDSPQSTIKKPMPDLIPVRMLNVLYYGCLSLLEKGLLNAVTLE